MGTVLRYCLYAVLAIVVFAAVRSFFLGNASAETPASSQVVSQDSDTVLDKTKDGAVKAWDKTKEVTSDAAEATKDGAAKAWDKTKEVTSDAAEATKDGAAKAWDKTKEVTSDAAEAVKDAVSD